jgi:hypothetical protein
MRAKEKRGGARHLRRWSAMIEGMAYDEDLVNRIRELIAGGPNVSEQSMFGGASSSSLAAICRSRPADRGI